MGFFRRAIAASILLGSLALAAPEAQAMPVQGLAASTQSAASAQSAVQDAYYRVYRRYGWRRPVFYRRPFYAYGWRRPFGWRGYGYGPGYRRGWHNRRLLGSRAR